MIDKLWLVGCCTEDWDLVFFREQDAYDFVLDEENPDKWVLGYLDIEDGFGSIDDTVIVRGEWYEE